MDVAAVGLFCLLALPVVVGLRLLLRLCNIAARIDEAARPRLDALTLAAYVHVRTWATAAARWYRYHSIKGTRYRRRWRHSPKESTR